MTTTTVPLSRGASSASGACIALALVLLGSSACTTMRTTPGYLASSSATAVSGLGGAAWSGTLVVRRASASAGNRAVASLGRAAAGSHRAVRRAGSFTGELAIDVMDANPAADAGFLPEPERLVARERKDHPFQRVWAQHDLDLARFDRIQIAPVDAGHVLKNNFWEKLSTATLFNLEDDAPRLALRLHAAMVEAFEEDPLARFQVVETPCEQTLVLEIALIEVVPNKSFLALGALASMAAPPMIGTPIGTLAGTAEHGVVAIEGRVRDGATGDLLAMFSDREAGKTRILDLQSVRWYGHAYEIFDDWAEQLVAVANEPAQPAIDDPAPFRFRPW